MGDIIQRKISSLRVATTANPSNSYEITDIGKEGMFKYNSSDTTSKDDGGTTIVSSSGLRFTRQSKGKLRASWYDIVPGDPTKAKSNTLNLNTLLENNKSTPILFTKSALGTNNVYYLDLLYLAQDLPKELANQAAINLFDNNNTLEQESGVSIQVVTEGMGMQSIGLITRPRPKFVNFSLTGTGGYQSLYLCIGYRNYLTNEFIDARPNKTTYENQTATYKANNTFKQFQDQTIANLPGLKPGWFDNYGGKYEYDDDWGHYENNGFNMWSACDAEGLFIGNFSGHGICGFGNTQGTNIRGKTSTFTISEIRSHSYGTTAIVNTTDDAILSIFNPRTYAYLHYPGYLEAGTGGISRISPTQVEFQIGVAQDSIIPPVGPCNILVDIYTVALNLFADGGRLNNIEASFNGANGVFTTGDECNTNTFINLGTNNNGGWGVCDSSLLGNTFIALKTATNGQHFNALIYNNLKLRQGGITNRGNSNTRTIIVGAYHEQDQIGGDLNGNSIDLGGVDGFGVTGGYGLGDGGLMKNLFSGFPGAGARIYHGSKGDGQTWYNSIDGSNQIPYFHEPFGRGFRIRGDDNHIYFGYSKLLDLGNKKVSDATILFNIVKDGKVEYRVNSLTEVSSLVNEVFNQGDKIVYVNAVPELPEYYVCQVPGSTKTMQEGIQARGDGSNGIIFTQIPTGITVGDVFDLADGTRVQIYDSNNNGTPTQQGSGYVYFIGTSHPTISQSLQNVDYGRAKWKAAVNGTGITTIRPNFANTTYYPIVVLPGWQYFNTTTNKLDTWNGSAYI